MNYRERLTPPPSFLVLAVLLAASFSLIVVPLSTSLAIAVAVTLGSIAAAVALVTSPLVVVDGVKLRAGRAQITGEFLGDVSELTKEEVRRLLGADVRAYACHRDYAIGGVKVEIVDPRDPTPYWIISTDEPEALAQAVRSLKAS